jgi:hypothetical protein
MMDFSQLLPGGSLDMLGDKESGPFGTQLPDDEESSQQGGGMDIASMMKLGMMVML